MNETTTPPAVLCPHPGCEALLRLQPTLPAGTRIALLSGDPEGAMPVPEIVIEEK